MERDPGFQPEREEVEKQVGKRLFEVIDSQFSGEEEAWVEEDGWKDDELSDSGLDEKFSRLPRYSATFSPDPDNLRDDWVQFLKGEGKYSDIRGLRYFPPENENKPAEYYYVNQDGKILEAYFSTYDKKSGEHRAPIDIEHIMYRLNNPIPPNYSRHEYS